MRIFKQLLFTVFISAMSLQTYSQISGSGQLSYLNLFGGTGVRNIGIGVKGEYASDDRLVYTGGINYYLQSKTTETITAGALGNQTDPPSIDVELERAVTFLHIYGGIKYYLVGDYEDDFGVYGIGEAGFLRAPVTTTVGDYDRTEYTSGYESEETEVLSNLTLNFGVGAEKDLDFGYLFADVKLILPATQANGQQIGFDIPASFCINAGVRFPF